MDRWEDDRGERLCPGCSFSVRVWRVRDGRGREVLSLSFTRLSPDLSALRLCTMICRMPGISMKRGRKEGEGEGREN